MPDDIRRPDSPRLAPQLAAWCAEAQAGEECTAVVRPAYSTDLRGAVRELEQIGVTVQSSGPGAITVISSPAALARISRLPWVVTVEEPRLLFPSSLGLR